MKYDKHEGEQERDSKNNWAEKEDLNCSVIQENQSQQTTLDKQSSTN